MNNIEVLLKKLVSRITSSIRTLITDLVLQAGTEAAHHNKRWRENGAAIYSHLAKFNRL
jgi:hypothetical protein